MAHPSDLTSMYLFPRGTPIFRSMSQKSNSFLESSLKKYSGILWSRWWGRQSTSRSAWGPRPSWGSSKENILIEAWDEHQYKFCQTMNSNFIFWSISWRCTELPKSLQFKIKIKWTQNEKVDKNKKYCLKKYFNFVDCTLTIWYETRIGPNLCTTEECMSLLFWSIFWKLWKHKEDKHNMQALFDDD